MAKTIYKSRIDVWVLCILAFALVVITVLCMIESWTLALIYGTIMVAIVTVCFFGCWYEIDGDQLVVYQFFRPHRFPISKIKEVSKTIGYLATAGMSRRRVTITFTSPSVMKSFMPLEISPKNRDSFIAQLKNINPAIIEK